MKKQLDEVEQRVVRRAIRIIEARGWCQGEFNAQDGAHCAAGAILLAAAQEYADAQGVLRSINTHLVEERQTLITWNDQLVRTKDEVIGFLRSTLEYQAPPVPMIVRGRDHG
jgi:hypothetical protein